MAFHSKNDEMEIENTKKIRGKIVEIKIRIKIKIKTNEDINYSCLEVQEDGFWPIHLQVIFWPLTMMTCMLFFRKCIQAHFRCWFCQHFPLLKSPVQLIARIVFLQYNFCTPF